MIKKTFFFTAVFTLICTQTVLAETLTETPVDAPSAEILADAIKDTPPVEGHLTQGYDLNKKMYTQALSDQKVFFSNIPDGMITNRGVVFELETGNFFYTLVKDGEVFEYTSGGVITDPGYYHLNILALPEIEEGDIPEPTMEELYSEKQMPEFQLYEDASVYSADFYFVISCAAENRMDFINAPNGYKIRYLEKDGMKISQDADGWQRLREDGTYHFLWQPLREGMPSCESVIIRDTTPPSLLFKGVDHTGHAAHGMTVTAQEPGVTVTAGSGGSDWVIEGEKIKQPGIYNITARDAAGNQSRYTVVVEADMTIIILLIAMGLLVIGIVSVIYIRYKRTRFQVR